MLSAVRRASDGPLLSLRAVFSNHDLRLVELARGAAFVAAGSVGLRYAVLVYEAGGTGALGVLVVAQLATTALVAPFGALVGDRFPRRRVMIAADLGRVGVAAATLAADESSAPAAAFIALALATAALGTVSAPARTALVPALARTPEELTAANVVASTLENLGSFAGPALAGLLLAASGHTSAIAVTGVLCLISAALLKGVRTEGVTTAAHGSTGGPFAGLTAGFRELVHEPDVRVVSALFVVQSLIAGMLGVVVVVVAIELLDLGESGVGFIGAASSIGALIGAAATLAVVGRRGLALGLAGGFVLWGVALMLIGAWPELVPALLLFGLVGLAEAVLEICALTLLQRVVRQEVLARVFGALTALFFAAGAIGAALGPALLALLGTRGTLVVAGAVLPLAALLSWQRLRRLDAEAPPALKLLSRVPFLAPLTPATLERLAEDSRPVELAPGETLFRQGEPGHRFYVVDEGRVRVDVDGRSATRLGAGDFVGEIALIRGGPRTATVTAEESSRLYAVDSEAFLEALAGSESVREAADAVVGARLRRARPGGVAPA